MEISIHAPAKGATKGTFSFCWRTDHFNPRSREGSDRIITLYFSSLDPFQSTLPRRERRYMIDLPPCKVYFNPRSREGSDGSECSDRV